MLKTRDKVAANVVQEAAARLVPQRPEGGLPTDPHHLGTMFYMCVTNWKMYMGKKPKGRKLARIKAVYKQATKGDCTDTEWGTEFEKILLSTWRSYKGMPADAAKRRFLNLLQEWDPKLLVVKPYTTVPWGFPRADNGLSICPYSNTTRGCPLPLTDKSGRDVVRELETNDSLTDFLTLKAWLDDVLANQRCSLGRHQPIEARQAKPFQDFFARPECQGFKSYVPTVLHKTLKQVLTRQFYILLEMQEDPRCPRDHFLIQRDRVLGLQYCYAGITGEEFSNEAPCTKDTYFCNSRRLVEGENHCHPVVIKRPPPDMSVYDEVMRVRRECARLGVDVATGPVRGVEHRMHLLLVKVAHFHRQKMLVYESQRRQQWRHDTAPGHAAARAAFARSHAVDQVQEACNVGDVSQVCRLVEKGAPAGVEARSGVFPLMLAVLKRSKAGLRRLVDAGADVDYENRHGMTAAMWAAKRGDYVLAQLLLEAGADVGLEGRTGWTLLSVCARHGQTDVAELVAEHVLRDKIVGRMNADRALNHRSTAQGGVTPLMLAARHRDERTARILLRLGADPAVKCYRGLTAGDHAMRSGWKMLGQWLRETKAFGEHGVYSFVDTQVERQLMLGRVAMLEAVTAGNMVAEAAAGGGGGGGGDGGGGGGGSSGANAGEGPGGEGGGSSAREGGGVRQTGSEVAAAEAPAQAPAGDFFGTAMNQLQVSLSTIPQTVEVLQGGRAAPDTETDGGHTALLSWAYRGQDYPMQLLMEEGCDPNYSTRNGRTPLMAAAIAGQYKAALLLLSRGADAAATDVDGWPASTYATGGGCDTLAQLLNVAASRGPAAAIAWDRDRRERESEREERERRQAVLSRVGGMWMAGDTPEGDLRDWMVNNEGFSLLTAAAAAAAAATTPGTGIAPATADTDTPQSPKSDAGSATPPTARTVTPPGGLHSGRPGTGASAGQPRCPKCTLPLPCAHYDGLQWLLEDFPNGLPEWRWERRPTNSRSERRVRASREEVDALRRRAAAGAVNESTGWRALLRSYRDHVLFPDKPLGFDKS